MKQRVKQAKNIIPISDELVTWNGFQLTEYPDLIQI